MDKKLNVGNVLALTAFSAFCVVLSAKAADAPQYERGVDGKDHAILYRNVGGNDFNAAKWDYTSDGSAHNVAWTNDAIAVLTVGNVGWGSGMNAEAYAIRPEQTSFFFFGTLTNASLRLGAGGIEFANSGASMETRFKSSNALHLTASQTWKAAEGKTATLRINWTNYLDDDPFVLTAEDDITLSISGGLTWEMNQSAAFQKVDVNVTSPAKIHLSATANANGVLQGGSLNARTLTNDGGYVQVKSMTGDPCRVAANVVLKNNATLAVNCDTSSTMADGLALDDVTDSIAASVGTGIVKGSVAPSETAFPVSAAAGATLSLRAAWRGSPSFALSGAGTIEFDGSGDAPHIASAEGFTGTLVLKQSCTFASGILESFGGSIIYRANAVITGCYPTPVDFSHISVENGAKLTLNWYSPNAPVSYTSGMTVATGLGTGVTTDDLTVSYRQEAGDKTYPASLGVDVAVVDGTLSTTPSLPRPQLTYQGTYFDNSSNYWKNESGVTVGWTDGAIAVLSGQNGRIINGTLSPYQLFMPSTAPAQGGFIGGSSSGDNVSRLHLGAGGLDLYKNGPTLWNLLEFRLTSPQVWCHTNSDATVSFTIGNHEQSGHVPDLVTADTDCGLTILGSLAVYLNAKGDFRYSDITLDGTKANNAAKLILDNVKSAASTATDITLNAKTLTIKGHSVLTVNSDDRVEGGWTIAKDLVLVSNANGTPEVNFGTDANNAVMGLDVATISSTGTGSSAKMTGTARIVSDALPVTIASGSSLNFAVGLANAAEKSAAVTLHGAGELVLGCKNAAEALRLTSATVADFTGTVRVPNGGVLSLDGTVNLAGVTLENGAIVDMNAGAGATIADWSNVTFPASGTVTISLRSDVPYAAAMQSVAVPGDFSGVSSADRAKILIVVDDGQGNSPYSVNATPRFDGDTLYADLSASMVNGSVSNGRTVWLGEDFGDARVLSNWTKYESDGTFNPSIHPDSVSTLDGTWLSYGLCSAMNWKIDLGGLELHVNDMRNNSSNPHYYAISNGTMHAQSAMLWDGAFDVWNGGCLLVDAYRQFSGIAGFWLRTNKKTSPFRLTVHDGGEMKATGEHQGFNFDNLECVVEDGGRLEMSAKSMGVMGYSSKNSAFINYGTMCLPQGWIATNTNVYGEYTATCTVAQCAGRLEYAGAFDVAQRDGCHSNVTYRIAVYGGTLAPQGDVSFAEWDLQIAPDADFGVEVRTGEVATLGDFNWGDAFTLTKTGAGAFELTVTNSVESGTIVVRDGWLVNGGDLNVGSLAVTYADDGWLSADPDATGAAADYGLLLTNATVSAAAGKYNVRFTKTGSPVWINILTVPASADPGLATANVHFSTQSGLVSMGRISRDEVVVGGIPCVRYSACRKLAGMSIIFR